MEIHETLYRMRAQVDAAVRLVDQLKTMELERDAARDASNLAIDRMRAMERALDVARRLSVEYRRNNTSLATENLADELVLLLRDLDHPQSPQPSEDGEGDNRPDDAT